MAFISVGTFTPVYSISLFLPTIIKELGFANNTAQLMTVPPYALACVCTITGSYFADKAGQRGIFLLGFEILAILGFILLISTGIPFVQYTGTFLAAAGEYVQQSLSTSDSKFAIGIYPTVPLIGAWNSNNIGGSLKRGVGIAMQVGIGNFGGIIAAFVYISKDEPR